MTRLFGTAPSHAAESSRFASCKKRVSVPPSSLGFLAGPSTSSRRFTLVLQAYFEDIESRGRLHKCIKVQQNISVVEIPAGGQQMFCIVENTSLRLNLEARVPGLLGLAFSRKARSAGPARSPRLLTKGIC